MRTFRDATGREWAVVINAAVNKRVKSLLGFSLSSLADDGAKPLGELLADDIRLVDTLYVLCRQQCEERHLTDEQFAEGFGGDVLEVATDAFLEEWVDFFRNPRARAALRKLIAHGKELGSELMGRAEKQINALNVKALADEMTTSTGTDTSGKPPAASALTPAP